jgi:hypothetical protein
MRNRDAAAKQVTGRLSAIKSLQQLGHQQAEAAIALQ